MDHAWAAQQLKEFRDVIDDYYLYQRAKELTPIPGSVPDPKRVREKYGSYQEVVDRLISLNPIMRDLMNAAEPEIGNYVEPPGEGWSYDSGDYWRAIVRPRALRAIGIHEFGEEARRLMRPD